MKVFLTAGFKNIKMVTFIELKMCPCDFSCTYKTWISKHKQTEPNHISNKILVQPFDGLNIFTGLNFWPVFDQIKLISNFKMSG